jgi:hypothetical protein
MGASSKRRKKMKTLAKFVMLLVVLAFCLPADGEILIYTKTMKCFGAEGYTVDGDPWVWDWVGDERVTGFLILDVVYDGNDLVYIEDAEQVEYWREGRDKYYEQWGEWFELERIELPGRTEWAPRIVWWVLENWWLDEDETYEHAGFVMHRGKAKMGNIGLGWRRADQKEVAPALQGCLQYFDWGEDDPNEYLEI